MDIQEFTNKSKLFIENVELADKSKAIIEKTGASLYSLLIYVVSILKNNLADFIKFLFDKNIIQTGIGIIIATQISKLTNLVSEVLINPIVNRITAGTVKDINEWKITFFDIEIKIGLLISSIINFVFVVVIVFYIWKISKNTNFKFITDILSDTEQKISKTKVIINVAAPVN